MRSVHIVIGDTGLYPEDSATWPVAAFSTKARAETFVRRVNDWLTERELHRDNYNFSLYFGLHGEYSGNPYDPDMQVIDSGVRYTVSQVFLDPPLPLKSQGA